MQHVENVIVGKIEVQPHELFAKDMLDWTTYEKDLTIQTDERYLPKILLDLGIAPSLSEVRRNKPQLCITLDTQDFIIVKWGKRKLWLAVGGL